MEHETRNLNWRKSARSGAKGNCVELAWLDGDGIAVRNSRCPAGPALVYPRAGLVAFLVGTKADRFS